MKYYYFPSSYFGARGGGYGANAGYLVGCGRRNKRKKVRKIKPEKIQEKANFMDQMAIEKMEEKGTPTEISEKQFDLYNYLGEGRDAFVDYMKQKYANIKDYGHAGKNWILGKYREFGDWYEPRARGTRIFGTAAIKLLWQKIKSIPGAIKGYFIDLKNRAVTSVKDMWNRFKEWMRNIGVNIYAYGKATLDVYKKLFGEAIVVGWQILKEMGKKGIAATGEVLKLLSVCLGNIGWTPVQIALAINLIRNPPTFRQEVIMKIVELLPNIGGAIVKAITAAKMASMVGIGVPPVGKGYLGYGAVGLGAGIKRRRRGRFVKGSPEAKAYMAYLRSLRRS